MRIINNPLYLFTALENGYQISSRSEDLSIVIKVENIDKYEERIEVLQKVLEPLETFIFSVTSDGRYVLTVDLEPKVYFTHFASIRSYILSELPSLICNTCKCNCSDFTVNCLEKRLRLAHKQLAMSNIIQNYIRINKDFSLVYNNIASSEVRTFLDTVYNDDYYKNQEATAKQLVPSVLSGEIIPNISLYQYHLAAYYIALYFEAKLETTNLEEEKALDVLYRYSEVLPCLLQLGLNPNDMTKEFNKSETNLYYWQTSPTDTIQTVVATLTREFLLSKPSLPIAQMYEGTIIPLTSVGKLVFAISEIANANFIIQDSLGTDVTNDFDYAYDSSTETALFVSQLVYSHSNIYFIFKKLI